MNKNTRTLTAGRPSTRSNKVTSLTSLVDEAGMKRVNFELPAAEHTKLKIYAAKHGKTVKELLTEYIVGLPE